MEPALNRPSSPSSGQPTALRRPLLVGALLCLWAGALSAGIELERSEEESPPTTEDLYGIAGAPNGEILVVGNNATVLRRTTDPDGSPQWTSLASWAAGFFTAELFDVAHSPLTYPSGEAWVIGGRDGVVETDFVDTEAVDLRPGTNAVFTPVLPTEDEIWYGVPDLGTGLSFLHRYDRADQTNPGISFAQGAVLAMCQIPGGNLRYVTTDGDIQEIDDDLQVTSLYDQPVGQSLELNAATFSEDCEFISGGDATSLSRLYGGFLGILRNPRIPNGGPPPSPWRFVDRPGEPIVTSAHSLDKLDQITIRNLFTLYSRCDDSVPTGDDFLMEAIAVGLIPQIVDTESFNVETECQLDGLLRDIDPGFPRGPMASQEFEYFTVGAQGRVQRMVGRRVGIFADGFETADTSRWSMVVR